MAGVLFHCPCTAKLSLSRPPPSDPPLSTYQHHPLSTLLFCEECDAIRCDSCVAGEISCYYCPTCWFEVPSASVRGEKNRCARNCFQCPQCCHTLSVVASDPDPNIPLTSAAANVGQPPFYLSCAFCLWDSKKVGIKFDKPTGLALQLQKSEDSSPEILEFDHLKEHLEPFLRRGQALQPSTSTSHVTASSNALPSSLLKDNPSLATRYGNLFGLGNRARVNEGRGAKDDLEVYHPLESGKRVNRDAELVKQMMEMTDIEEVASLDKRWLISWKPPILASDLKPLRTPLQAKQSKRCPTCKHILIKPEQKSSSTRFKIKLVASNYLPSIEVFRRPPPSIGSRLSAIGAGTASGMRRTPRTAIGRSSNDTGVGGSSLIEEEPLRPGRTYTFELSFTNPLYEPIHVKLAVARPSATGSKSSSPSAAADGSTQAAPPAPPPYAVNLPSPSFPISAYAEEWEYDDEDEEIQGRDGIAEEDEDELGGVGGSSPFKKRKSKNAPGIIERKMNRTTVAMEVAVGRDTVGPIRASMLVTYMYQSDEGSVPPSPSKSPKKGGIEREDVKSFSFWTLFQLGTVVPRPSPDSRRSVQSPSLLRLPLLGLMNIISSVLPADFDLQSFVDSANAWLISHQLLVASQLILFSIFFFYFIDAQPAPKRPKPQLNPLPKKTESGMDQVAPPVLNAPLDTPISVTELKKFDGTKEGHPIYVAIKGVVFDVTAKRDMYGPGTGYSVFAGKDASRALGKSSLKPEDALADYSTLTEAELTVLEDWMKYFKKRYNIVGKVVQDKA